MNKVLRTLIAPLLAISAVATVPQAADASTHRSSRHHGCEQWRQLANEVGIDNATFNRFSPIMWRESRCNPGAVNYRSGDYGLMQIHCAGGANWCARIGVSRSEMLDPTTNLKAALFVLDHQGMSAWS